MLKNIGIIGYGFVGKACHNVFVHNTEPIIVDPKYTRTTVKELVEANPPLTFIAINAPTLDSGKIDASAIYTVFEELYANDYKGVIVLKTTLTPDIVQDLADKFAYDRHFHPNGKLRLVYSPEFLREKHWEKDSVEPAFIIVAGDFFDCEFVEDVYKKHSQIRTYVRFFKTSYQEAALVKYAINAYLATKVVFMNQLYQLFTDMEGQKPHYETWNAFVDILSADFRLGNSHMKVPGEDGQFGYGGSCFPKDIRAFLGYDKNNRLSVLKEAEIANTKIRLTGDDDPVK